MGWDARQEGHAKNAPWNEGAFRQVEHRAMDPFQGDPEPDAEATTVRKADGR